MPDQEAQQEPSMEEILASIRRIISEEDEDGAKPEAEAADSGDEDSDPEVADAPETAEPEMESVEETSEEQPVDQDDDDDILELTEVADEEPAAESDDPIADENDIDAIMAADDTDDELLLEEGDAFDAVEAAPVATTGTAVDDTALVSEPQAAMAASSFAALRSPELAGAMQIGGAYTVEGLVREMLRPMLKQWLDIHLPSIVEEAVRDEIARIANQDRKE